MKSLLKNHTILGVILSVAVAACGDDNPVESDSDTDSPSNVVYSGSFVDGLGDAIVGASVALRTPQGELIEIGAITSDEGLFSVTAERGSGPAIVVLSKHNTTTKELEVSLNTGHNFQSVTGNIGPSAVESAVSRSIAIGETLSEDTKAFVTNDEEGNAHLYRLSSYNRFSISGDGILSLQPTGINTYQTIITFIDATDSSLVRPKVEFELTVTATPNSTPTITSHPGNVTVAEEESYVEDYGSTVSDHDGDPLTFSVDPTDHATVSFAGNELQFVGSLDFAGEVNVGVYVTDGRSDLIPFSSRVFTVENRNDPPSFDSSQPYSSYRVPADTTFRIPVRGFDDPDLSYSDVLTPSLIGLTNASYVIETDSLAVTPDSGWDGDMSDVAVRMTDLAGDFADSNTFPIMIRRGTANNTAPYEVSPTDLHAGYEDKPIDVVFDVGDNEGDLLSFLFDEQSGLYSTPISGGFRYWIDPDSSGTFVIQAYAFDGSLTTTLTPFPLTFESIPDAPRMKMAVYPDQITAEDEIFKEYMPNIWYSPDGKDLSFGVNNLSIGAGYGMVRDWPSGVETDTLFIQAYPGWSGIVSGLEYWARDDISESVSNLWTLTVEPVNDPPKRIGGALPHPVYIAQGTSYVLDMSNYITDDDGDPLIYEVMNLQSGVTYSIIGDVISFTPAPTFVGLITGQFVTVTDGKSPPIVFGSFDLYVQ